MCGILAVLGAADWSQAKRAHHRGPDWSGLYQCEGNFLAQQRLAIVSPLSGDQPLYNADRTIVVVANGEIYNHKKIRKQFASKHTFSTGSDCEVIIPLYEEYGEDFVDMLDGVFAFVLYDTRTKTYMAARDAIGVNPLYIGRGSDGAVWISSEMKALNEDCVEFEIFPPGHLYSSAAGGLRRWYKPQWFAENVPATPYQPLLLREAFEKAVIKRLMTDVPFGVLLSGGLDSSLVAAVTKRHLIKTEAAEKFGAELHSFVVGLEGSPDLIAAREVADHLGTIHHEFHFTVQDGIDAIEEVIYHDETYDVTTIRASTPMFLMARKIKALGVKMVLSGEGSDELLGGYLYFHFAPNKEEFHKETCRKKEQFSDGVGYNWIDGLKAFTEQQVSDEMMKNAAKVYPHNTPVNKEAYYYRMIFERLFPQESARETVPWGPSIACSTPAAIEWVEQWKASHDPSGRLIASHNSASANHTNHANANANGNSNGKANGNCAMAANGTNGVGLVVANGTANGKMEA
uniref:Asparagine synthetase [glutamine-hydrolyzing] n=1 Tax=Oryza nivara TaxID=4536 RepID=A0A0E0GL33_ORYNI